MSEENKYLVRRFFEEVINAENMERAEEFVTAEYAEHQQLPGAEGRQGIEHAVSVEEPVTQGRLL